MHTADFRTSSEKVAYKLLHAYEETGTVSAHEAKPKPRKATLFTVPPS